MREAPDARGVRATPPSRARCRRRAARTRRCASSRARARAGALRRPVASPRLPRTAASPPRGAPPSHSNFERAPAGLGRQRVGELRQLSLEDAVELVLREPDPVVGDPVLREVVGADLLGAVARADLRPARRVELGALALELLFVEPRAQDAHRLLAVLQLRLL